MEKMKVPKSLHELMGKETTKFEFMYILGFAIASTLVIAWIARTELDVLIIWKAIFMIILMIDIFGGVIANLSYGTNEHYSQSNKRRIIFISIHVQPLLMMLISGGHNIPFVIIWIFAVVSAFLINAIRENPAQRVIGLSLSIVGLFMVSQFANELPFYIIAMLSMYIIKVVFSFPVNHYRKAV
ncbi:hypothetical protein GOQ27_06260 [Clostridium sp. D2Q-11]|uniref:Uncharacterized protein n=1 Tax=Anaeromonas frigoriresistens TaxID=2683708 RepID=A0A942Z6X4_9FIRM|nr:hypothetical protein [Anaeromonas frigoriresistens]MBS4538057.1 hypothetical protein [Anaeromonas frigoriresistens]